MKCQQLVSIVIPIYNVEKYLDECLESVVNQTYNNLQIILVDDGSPDSCPEICEKWARVDERITVIHKENAGLGEARNSGLEIATGEYVYFLDSDDYLSLDAIEKLSSIAIKEKADVVGSGQYRTDDQKNCYIDRIPDEYQVYRGEDIRRVFLPDVIAPNPISGHFIKSGACIAGQLFSLKTLKKSGWKCVSERNILSEDIYSFTELCCSIECAVEVPLLTLYYRKNPESLSQSYREDRFEKNVRFYLDYTQLLKNNDIIDLLGSRAQKPFFNNTIACLKQIVSTNEKTKWKTEKIRIIEENKVLQDAIRTYNFKKENRTYRILFFALEHRMTTVVYLLLKAKIHMENTK